MKVSKYINPNIIQDGSIDGDKKIKNGSIDGDKKIKNYPPLKKGRGENSVCQNSCTATGDYSHAEGYYTKATGSGSHAEGLRTAATGHHSHAEGSDTLASGYESHAEGSNTKAEDDNSHAEGHFTLAQGSESHAEGDYTIASGKNSHAEGNGTTASGRGSHAEGQETKASCNNSHAEGYQTEVSSDHSHAEGYHTTAGGSVGCHAEGMYNYDNIYHWMHTVGIGNSEEDRKNAHLILDDGKHYIIGIGGYEGKGTVHGGSLQEVVNGKQDKLTAGAGLTIDDNNTISINFDPNIFKVVSVLPEVPAKGDERKIHLIPSDESEDGNAYNEYIYVDSSWEKIGSFRPSIDLSDFIDLTSEQTITAAKTFSNGINMNNTHIRKVKTPTANDDAANKQYVDDTVKTNIATQVTYAELKSLRDAGKLVPGTQYRITDYTCTTSQANTRSAGHQFDIIVTADDASTLNEVARAALHTGDEYFSGCSINAWKIWYCLDNDTTRFAWADATNGKGIIYRMIDEFGNDCPYDFKNIIYIVKPYFIYNQWGYNYQFNRDSAIDMNIDGTQYYGYITESSPSAWSDNKCWIKEETPSINSTLYKSDGSNISYGGTITNVELDTYETYTFGKIEDLTINGNCYNNVMLSYYKSGVLTLNNNTFDSKCYNNIFGYNCYSNNFGKSCSNNIFGNDCSQNSFGNSYINSTFGNNCNSNTFGNLCGNNSFGNNCGNNTFGDSCRSNTFGNSCDSNTFGNSCDSNTFGNSCMSNTFGEHCAINSFGNNFQYNTFGNNCNQNSFGDSCRSNTFGNNYYSNTFGNNCNQNSFGDSCGSNTFGNSCDEIKFASDSSASTKYNYYRQNHFGDGCQYIIFKGAETASSSAQVQNYNFAQGLQGTSSAYLTIDGKRNLAYETKVAKNSNGELKVYCEADLIL